MLENLQVGACDGFIGRVIRGRTRIPRHMSSHLGRNNNKSHGVASCGGFKRSGGRGEVG